jgi:hypothetical protein
MTPLTANRYTNCLPRAMLHEVAVKPPLALTPKSMFHLRANERTDAAAAS